MNLLNLFCFATLCLPLTRARVGERPDQDPSITVNSDYQPHYLVGLLNYPNADIPAVLNGVTSGTKNIPGGPYNYVPR